MRPTRTGAILTGVAESALQQWIASSFRCATLARDSNLIPFSFHSHSEVAGFRSLSDVDACARWPWIPFSSYSRSEASLWHGFHCCSGVDECALWRWMHHQWIHGCGNGFRCPSGVDASAGPDLRQCCSRSVSVRSRPGRAGSRSQFLLARGSFLFARTLHCGHACIGWISQWMDSRRHHGL